MTNLDPLEEKSTENNHSIVQPTEELDKITDPVPEDDISPIVLVLCTAIPMIILIILFL
ncbi:hypothetical protein [Clostridium kluyveri]|uniref:Uncharacterized protein n=1 Tax=Clostridium kluyveri (strain ATCC 8527 / DSM 555 / NBRC 12016 / NCIMB 10680 / K1) TaxID=431943 RepID=A5N2U6_CLOK5|nr:hypothetical protein [Clostridium kluyveri]EDK35442.1 Hypothetical protein CKL_3440 [Clostridium kluyveri DSM 555]